jgi:hypothetical protein
MNWMGQMRGFKAGASLVLAAMLGAACASISENTHAYLGVPHFPPAAPQSVRIFPAEPKQPKDLLGEIILSVDGNPPRQKIEDKFKIAAARLGADGVFIVSDQTHIYPMVYWDCWGPVADEDWNRLIVGVAFKNK